MKKVRKEVTSLEEEKLDLTQPTFVCASEHQKAFNVLKVALTTAAVLRYPNFSREFILETVPHYEGWELFCPKWMKLVRSML